MVEDDQQALELTLFSGALHVDEMVDPGFDLFVDHD